MREIIHPKSKEEWLALRIEDITSTEVSALFGFCPYVTLFELWQRKKNKTDVKFEESERMKWGNVLQDAIAEGVAKEQGWKIRRMDEYIRGSDLKVGASFDFSIEGAQLGLLEIKNVDSLQFKQNWIKNDSGELEAPLHIEIQVQHQLLCSGRKFAYIGALSGGNKLTLLKRERNMVVLNKIKEKVSAFWQSIDDNIPPEPNFETDSEFIAGLYGFAEPGKFLDVSGNEEITEMAIKYKELGDTAKAAEKARKEIKAKILMSIGDSEKVGGDMFSITAGMVAPADISYHRDAYRMFRINWRKK